MFTTEEEEGKGEGEGSAEGSSEGLLRFRTAMRSAEGIDEGIIVRTIVRRADGPSESEKEAEIGGGDGPLVGGDRGSRATRTRSAETETGAQKVVASRRRSRGRSWRRGKGSGDGRAAVRCCRRCRRCTAIIIPRAPKAVAWRLVLLGAMRLGPPLKTILWCGPASLNRLRGEKAKGAKLPSRAISIPASECRFACSPTAGEEGSEGWLFVIDCVNDDDCDDEEKEDPYIPGRSKMMVRSPS